MVRWVCIFLLAGWGPFGNLMAADRPLAMVPASRGTQPIVEPAGPSLLPCPVVLRVYLPASEPAPQLVDVAQPVRRTVLGTSVVGTNRTRGIVQTRIDPQAADGGLLVMFRGETSCRTTGRQGPIVIRSRTTTRFTCQRRITVAAAGRLVAGPVQVTAATDVVIEGISSTRRGLVGRIARRVAWQRAQATLPRARRVANESTRRELQVAFAHEIDQELATLNRRIDSWRHARLLVGEEVRVKWSPTPSAHVVQIGLGEPTVTPPTMAVTTVSPSSTPFEVWIHESTLAPGTARFGQAMLTAARFVSTGRQPAHLATQWMRRSAPDNRSPIVSWRDAWLVVRWPEREPTSLASADTASDRR